MHLKQALAHNLIYVVETLTVWMVVAWSHTIGAGEPQPAWSVHGFVIAVLPVIQLVSLLLASCASLYTMYKIRKDLKEK